MKTLFCKIRLIENKIQSFVYFHFVGFKLVLIVMCFCFSFFGIGQNINFPNSGGGVHYSCGGVFRDPGGTGVYTNPGKGSDPWDQIIYICNPTPGQPISVYFEEFQLARNSCVIPTYDQLWVGIWNGSNYAIVGYYSSHPDGGYNAVGVSHSSDFYVTGAECLAFRFIRDQIGKSSLCGKLGNAQGWKATLSTPPPNAGALSGVQSICISSTTTFLSDGQSGGTWSSANSSIASVNNFGVVTGVSPGTTTISYTVSDACSRTKTATRTVTVSNALNAGVITGLETICTNTSVQFSTSGDTGGTWTSSNTSVASVDATGLVTPLQVGATTISYELPAQGGCPSSTATLPISIITPPDVGTISGVGEVCANESIVLSSNSSYSGIWSSSNTSLANVDNMGTVTPTSTTSTGQVTISYTINATPGCVSVSATKTVDVLPLPNAGTISGDVILCLNDDGTVSSNGLSGGLWSSDSPTIVNVDTEGNIDASGVGTAMVTYSVTDNNSCTNSATQQIVVNALPDATISGATDVCFGGQTQLSVSDFGGVWTSANNLIAEVDQNGLVSAVTDGNTAIYYSIIDANNCSNTDFIEMSVWSTDPPEIIGNTQICFDEQVTLLSPLSNGTWSVDGTSVVIINSNSGTITNIAPGTATITYTVNQAGCLAINSVPFTVYPLPDAGTIIGDDKLCLKSAGSFSASVAGGIWSSQFESIALIDEYGNVMSMSPGSTSIIYTVTDANGCSSEASRELVVLALPNPGVLAGADDLCVGNTTTLSSTASLMFIASEEWSSNQPNIAFIGSDGLITGVSAGTATITHKLTDYNNCSNQASKMVNILSSNAGTISGGVSNISEGYSTVFVSNESGGVWSTSNTLASADPQTGKVTAISPGETTVYYILSNMCGTDTARANLIITTAFANLTTPQIISPNGDGMNDKWIVDFLSDYPNNNVYIYNRWGTKIFEQHGYGPGKEFSGVSNKGVFANELPNGTYFYIIDVDGDGKNLVKGYVELQR